MKNYLHTCLVVFTMLILISCGNNSNSPTNPGSTDNFLTGKVVLYNDEYGNTVQSHEGVHVEVSMGSSVYTAQTDSSGKWIIRNIPTGIYNIVVTKEGYDTLSNNTTNRMSNVQYVGVGGYYLQKLWLAKAISPDMISNGSGEVSTVYVLEDHSNTGKMDTVDTTGHINIRFDTKNNLEWNYSINIVDEPFSDCSNPVVSSGLRLTRTPGSPTISLDLGTYTYNKLKKIYGRALYGKTLFVQIRPEDWRHDPRTASDQDIKAYKVCLRPLIIPITF